jgi:membrane-bound ClpP family serine protease
VLIGTTGTARGDLAPQGILHIAGEDWSAVTEGDHIRSGEQAQVVRIEGLTLVVRPSSGTEVVPSA